MEPIKVTKPISLEDGKYEGKIVEVVSRTSPQGYEYVDIVIEESEKEIRLKYGCPKSGSPNGKLMKLCSKFTAIEEGKEIDPEEVLKGKEVSFLVNMGEKFAEIAENSVKPKGNGVQQSFEGVKNN